METFEQHLVDERARTHAISMLRLIPLGEGLVCSVAPETRTQAQNRLLWPLLTEVSRQHVHYGRSLIPQDWKNLFMGGLAHAVFVPSLDGQSVMPLGLSTSVLSKARFSDLLELIHAFGAEHDIKFQKKLASELRPKQEDRD